MDEPKNRGQAQKQANQTGDMPGRSGEARDPNRPIDPETGEKEPLPPRFPEDEAPEEPVEEPPV